MNWIEHKGVLYNLNRFNQIVCGDDDEILLANIPHNDNWDQDDIKNMCSLIFDSKDQRDEFFSHLEKILILRVKNDL